MQITDILTQTGGLQSIAGELGISEAQAAVAPLRSPRRFSAGSRSRSRPILRGSAGSAVSSPNWAAAVCSTACSRPNRPT